MLQKAGELDMQSAPLMQQLAVNQTMHSLVRTAESNPRQAQEVISLIERVDPKRAQELSSKFVPDMGFALTEKDADALKSLKATVDTARDGLSHLSAISAVPGKSLSLEMRAQADTIAQSLVGLLRAPITGPGAMSDGERKMLNDIVANPTKVFSLDSTTKTRLQTLSSRLGKSLEMEAKARGIKNPRISGTVQPNLNAPKGY